MVDRLWGPEDPTPAGTTGAAGADAAGTSGAAGADGAADAEEVPARRRRVRIVVLVSLVAIAVAGAALFGATGWRIIREKDAELATPDNVAGLVRDRSAEATETAEFLRSALAAGVDVDGSVAAVYSDPAAPDRSVLFFGGTGLLFRPERELDSVFTLLADENGGVTGVRDVSAGKLGGVMRCGETATAEDGTMSVCGWADHGSIAAAMFLNRSTDDSARLLRAIRDTVQTRS
jgi:hypothetical protein